MPIWTLAKKEMRLLLRDRTATVILLGLPLVFILILGRMLGNSDERVRITVVDLDRGLPENTHWLPEKDLEGLPRKTWSQVVIRDLEKTGGIRVEVLSSRAEAEEKIRYHRRSAVIVFDPDFSEKAYQCSFLASGINPFYRNGVYLEKVGIDLLTDEKQPAGAAITSQVAQVSLLRVLLPWMIGRAFENLSKPEFINLLGTKVNLPVPEYAPIGPLLSNIKEITVSTPFGDIKTTPANLLKTAGVKLSPNGNPSTRDLIKAAGVKLPLDDKGNVNLNALIALAANGDPEKEKVYRRKIGDGVQEALAEQFKKYDLTGMTWDSLTRSREGGTEREPGGPQRGLGPISRGAAVYQFLVPSYTVLFAFFLVLNVGRVFVDERTQGTLKRLRAAPIGRGTLLLGKLVPYFLLSLAQGTILLIAGRLVFGMRWGPEDWPLWRQAATLAPVVFTTSLAAMGLALLVAAVARTETQVVLYGAVPVLVLALIGGCVLPREWMPEQAQNFALFTPQGWALDAYRELLDLSPTVQPNLTIVFRSCAVLTGFGVVFIAMARGLLRLD